jgi:hypothetical protein
MIESEAPVERIITRRIFEAWSVEIPATFAETFVVDGSYWHAYDAERSVSLSSILLSDVIGPVSADRIVRELPSLEGSPLDELPPGLIGQAATGPAVQPAKAALVLSGVLARGRTATDRDDHERRSRLGPSRVAVDPEPSRSAVNAPAK